MEPVSYEGIRDSSSAAACCVNGDLSGIPFRWHSRVDGPVPVRETPGLGGICELRSKRPILVGLDDAREVRSELLFVERNIRAMPGRESIHYCQQDAECGEILPWLQ